MDFQQTGGRGRLALTVVLTIVLLVAFSGVVYLAATPYQQMDPHTEFYVLGPDGVANEYPRNLSVGEEGEFIVGATNNEHERTAYTVVVETDSTRFASETFTIEAGETWEAPVTIEFESAGTHRVNLYLYRSDSAGSTDAAYRELWLDVEVTE